LDVVKVREIIRELNEAGWFHAIRTGPE